MGILEEAVIGFNIVCLSDALRQYLEGFLPYFSKRQWKYFVIVLLNLVGCERRKTMSGLLYPYIRLGPQGCVMVKL